MTGTDCAVFGLLNVSGHHVCVRSRAEASSVAFRSANQKLTETAAPFVNIGLQRNDVFVQCSFAKTTIRV